MKRQWEYISADLELSKREEKTIYRVGDDTPVGE